MGEFKARVLTGAADVSAADWDACAGGDNPFLAHAFFMALEASGSACARTGWQPAHIVVDDATGIPRGIMPAYLKSHSQGEYVFDQGWAEAWERAGGQYYPKLQCSVPFTPATGPRLLLRDAQAAPALLAAAEALARQNNLSSVHVTFISEAQKTIFENQGWLMRVGEQYHWSNEGYVTFGDFLAVLSSRKRKAIRKEREGALSSGVEIVHLTGDSITEAHWDSFWQFYQDTGQRKWGRPYLTRAFFSQLGKTMGEKVLLMLAILEGRPVAGALNLIGTDCLYGRYWGATKDIPFLHFELCYYQAIEWAITNGKARVEAGAQGSHKLARGYRPVATVSAHFLPNQGFRAAVADFVEREGAMVAADIEAQDMATPFRRS